MHNNVKWKISPGCVSGSGTCCTWPHTHTYTFQVYTFFLAVRVRCLRPAPYLISVLLGSCPAMLLQSFFSSWLISPKTASNRACDDRFRSGIPRDLINRWYFARGVVSEFFFLGTFCVSIGLYPGCALSIKWSRKARARLVYFHVDWYRSAWPPDFSKGGCEGGPQPWLWAPLAPPPSMSSISHHVSPPPVIPHRTNPSVQFLAFPGISRASHPMCHTHADIACENAAPVLV